MPGDDAHADTRHSSLTTTKPMPAWSVPPPNMPPRRACARRRPPSRILASRFSSDSRAIASIPKVENSLRMIG